MTNYVCDKKLIGKNMAEARIRANLTQVGAAMEVGLSDSLISKIESGGRLPSLDTIFDYINTFNVDANFILGVTVENSIDSRLNELDQDAKEYFIKIFNMMLDEYPKQ